MIQKNERRSYASDLSDRQWAEIEPLFPRAGNRSKWEKRELVNAVLYFVDNGCKWRNLPHDFPPYTTAANFHYAAIEAGFGKRSVRRWWNGYGQTQDETQDPATQSSTHKV